MKYLRKTADEIFNAAKHLAALEQQIVESMKSGAQESVLGELEADRAKAAALLDRPLLQLEAMLAMRRQAEVRMYSDCIHAQKSDVGGEAAK